MSCPVNRRHPVAAAAVSALMALTPAACALTNVNAYVQTGASFGSYRTYAWAPVDALATGDPRLDNNQLFDARVRAQIDKGLGRRGFDQLTSLGQPDLLVHYHASLSQKTDIRELDRPPAPGASDTGPFVYDAGTLFVDLVDTRTNRLVWRGWAEGSVEGVIDDQTLMDERVDQAIERILGRLPGRMEPADPPA